VSQEMMEVEGMQRPSTVLCYSRLYEDCCCAILIVKVDINITQVVTAKLTTPISSKFFKEYGKISNIYKITIAKSSGQFLCAELIGF
jgi:hypothetical protein